MEKLLLLYYYFLHKFDSVCEGICNWLGFFWGIFSVLFPLIIRKKLNNFGNKYVILIRAIKIPWLNSSTQLKKKNKKKNDYLNNN